MFVFYFLASRTLVLGCCFSPFGHLEDKPKIDDDIFLCPFARLCWLRVLEGGVVYGVACRASLFIDRPCQTSFCPFLNFFLLVCFRRLCTLLPPLCVILVFTMCIRVLLLYASKITHIYFYFFIRARLCLFLSSLGSSVIGLPFPPLGCLSVILFLLM